MGIKVLKLAWYLTRANLPYMDKYIAQNSRKYTLKSHDILGIAKNIRHAQIIKGNEGIFMISSFMNLLT